MPDDRLQLIRNLHSFTKAGITDCKRALDDAGGDYFQALCKLFTPDAFREKDQAFQVRSMCGKAVLDPVTPEETDLMHRLREHFAALSVRPHHIYFSTEVLPRILFSETEQFGRLIASTGLSWVWHVWARSGEDLRQEHRLDPEGLNVSTVQIADGRQAAVIRMPQTKSEREIAFIVVIQRRASFRLIWRPHPLRYFLILKPIHAPNWNIVIVQECVLKRQDLTVQSHFYRENVQTSTDALVTLVDAIR